METSHYRTRSYSHLIMTFLIATVLSVPALAVTRNVKNYGAKGNGRADDTAAIQKAIYASKKGDTVYVPAGKYMINAEESLKLKSNMIFKMDDDATLAAIPNDSPRHYVLALAGVWNVQIIGGRILGERYKHDKTKKGEWGYGINVSIKSLSGKVYRYPSKNILIKNVHISNMWGDGIQVGGGSTDVEIRNVVSTNNRRQGLSITQAQRVKVINSEFSYTNGTAPEYGIDIEPDKGDGKFAKDVLIQGCYFHNNKGGGLLVYKKTSEITVRWNRFVDNTYGMYTVASKDGNVYSNEFDHNTYHGIALRGETTNYVVKNNIFRNNSTKAVGYNEDPDPLKEITGYKAGTKTHVNKSTATVNVDILTNRYAR